MSWICFIYRVDVLIFSADFMEDILWDMFVEIVLLRRITKEFGLIQIDDEMLRRSNCRKIGGSGG